MWIKFLLLFFVFSFLFRTDTSFDQDLGRHIKLGGIILQTGQVPKVNLFSYTNPDFSFINTHWLFGVLAYAVKQTVGLQWMLVVKVAVILISVWLVIKTIPKNNLSLLLPLGFIFLHVLRERIELRPEIFSFLFTALTIYILEKKDRLIYFLPLVQLIWINTHIYFFIGLLLQAIFLLSSLGSKLLNPRGWIGMTPRILPLVFIISVLISLLNPNGITGVLYPLNVTKNYGYTIVENQTMFLLESINFRDPNFLFVKISAGIILISIFLSLIRKSFEVKNLLLAIFGLTLALLNVRSFPYLVFLSLPAVLQNFGPLKKNKLFSFLFLVTCVLLLLESFFYLNGSYYKYRDEEKEVKLEFAESSREALDFVLTHSLENPIFNNFDIGSYIIYRGYPKYRVFVDGRPEAYPAQFFTGIYIPAQSDYNNFKELEKIYSFKTVIFSHTDQTPWGKAFLQNVIKDKAWNIVYIDDFMIVLVKDAGKLPIVDLAKLDPGSYQFNNHVSFLRLGLFLLNNQYIESGRQFIAKTLQLFPDDPIGNQLKGQTPKNIFFW